MTTTKRISAAMGVPEVAGDKKRTTGERLGAAAAAIILTLLALIAIGGLLWLLEVVWRAVL